MKSLKELYRIGKGPSSSHTMGPQRAAKLFLERCGNASSYEVTLYGSLAATGKGHMTDVAIEEVLKKHIVHINWEPQTFLPFHPNGMKFVGKDLNGDIIDEWTVYSIGGGALSDGTEGHEELGADDVYDLHTMADIEKWCYENGRAFWEYVEKCEDKDIWDYLRKIWETMKQSIRNGLNHEGVLPGPLKLQRKAATYLTPLTKDNKLWMALGTYINNINYGSDNFHDGGVYGMLGYKFNEHWEAFVYGQVSVANNYNSIYNRYAGYGYGPYGYRGYGYGPFGCGMYPGAWGMGVMPGGYGMGAAGANVLGAGVRYTNKNFSIGVSVEGNWYNTPKTPSYYKQYDYPVK